MTTITLHSVPIPAATPHRSVRLAVLVMSVLTFGLIGATAFGHTNTDQSPPASIETLSELNRAADAP